MQYPSKLVGSDGQMGKFEQPELELKKHSHSANMNLISYQTANFGPNGETRPIGKDREAAEDDTEETPQGEPDQNGSSSNAEEAPQKEQQQMFASMSDLNFIAAPAP